MISGLIFALVAYLVAGFFILTIGMSMPVIALEMIKNWLIWPVLLVRELRDW